MQFIPKIQYLIIGLLILSSCDNISIDGNKTTQIPILERKLHSPLDTMQIIKEANLTEVLSDETLMLSDSDILLYPHLDTILLEYIAFACLCPYWVEPRAYQKAQENKNTFKQSKYSYYLEAATGSLEINWRQCFTGNTVRFIGRHSKEIRPADLELDGYTAGKVFKYYSYQIIKPYKIWGPKIPLEPNHDENDSLWQSAVLIVN